MYKTIRVSQVLQCMYLWNLAYKHTCNCLIEVLGHAYNIQQWKRTVLDFMHTILHHLATKSHQDSIFVPLKLSMSHRT